jgi:hypothetical protein
VNCIADNVISHAAMNLRYWLYFCSSHRVHDLQSGSTLDGLSRQCTRDKHFYLNMMSVASLINKTRVGELFEHAPENRLFKYLIQSLGTIFTHLVHNDISLTLKNGNQTRQKM